MLTWQRRRPGRGWLGPAAVLAAAPLCRLYLRIRSRGRVVADPSLVRAEVAAVLGAGLRPDGTPTALLANRVDAAVLLLQRGSVQQLVMSGDDKAGGDQPAAMARVAVARGVPADRIELDRTGVDTAATCRRLLADHGDGRVVLVTQEFHAARTAYLAAKAGLDAVVFASPDAQVWRKALYKARVREVPASVKAVFVDRF